MSLVVEKQRSEFKEVACEDDLCVDVLAQDR